MSDISPIGRGSVGPLHHQSQLNGSRNGAAPTTNGAASHGSHVQRDRVELSEHARFMDRLRQLPEVRMERVEAAREAIENGVYESPDKLDIAVSRLLDDIL